MTAAFSTMGAATALALLAAALLAGARADNATARLCKAYHPQLRARWFPTDTTATRLYLHHCNIADFNHNLVKNLPNVDFIALSQNAIASINPVVFETSPKLKTLYLQYNRLQQMPAFGWNSCPRLETLLIGRNLLTEIRDPNTFSACRNLHQLSLCSNRITYIHPDTFRQLTELTGVNLFSNKLTSVSERMFENNKKLRFLELYDNRLTSLPDNFVANRGVVFKQFFFDSNPWPCTYLLELLEDVKRAGVTNYKISPNALVERYDGTLPECVFMARYPCDSVPSGVLRPSACSPQGRH